MKDAPYSGDRMRHLFISRYSQQRKEEASEVSHKTQTNIVFCSKFQQQIFCIPLLTAYELNQSDSDQIDNKIFNGLETNNTTTSTLQFEIHRVQVKCYCLVKPYLQP